MIPPPIQHGDMIELRAFPSMPGRQQETVLAPANVPTPLCRPLDESVYGRSPPPVSSGCSSILPLRRQGLDGLVGQIERLQPDQSVSRPMSDTGVPRRGEVAQVHKPRQAAHVAQRVAVQA